QGLMLGEALLFPEIRCLSNRLPALHRTVKNLVIRMAMAIPPFEVHRRRLAGSAEIGSVAVTLVPAVRSLAWQEPVIVHFPIVRWSHPAPQFLQVGLAAPPPEAV